MIKTATKIIALVAMMMIGVVFVFAQAESNTSKATFGELYTDADYFFHSVYWKDLEFDKFFAYSRFGANIPDAKLDIGTAFKLDDLYVALYYKGQVTEYEDGTTRRGKVNIANVATDPDKEEMISVRAKNKKSPDAIYGALVGLSSGLGVKFTFHDDLEITGAQPAGGFGVLGTYSDTWQGSLTPAIELGGEFGPISRIGFKMPIVYARRESTLLATDTVTYTTTTRIYNTTTNTWGDATNNTLINAEGNYLEPTIYLKMAFGALTLENDLSLRLYGVPMAKYGGKSGTRLGVANVESITRNVANAAGTKDQWRAAWDNRFYIADTITPSYTFEGENGKFSFAASAYLPMTIKLVTHSTNYKTEGKPHVVDGSQADVELNGIFRQSNFGFRIAPELNAGVKYQLLNPLSVQAGVGINLFDWDMTARSNKDTKLSTSDLAKLTHTGGMTESRKNQSTQTTSDFNYTEVNYALGFTFSFKDTAALDFVYINKAQPTIAKSVYRAVGDGMGNGDTSVVLTLKF
ncbi:MAG: hypothetical protein FWD36_02010 [Treponema sp.]|nr:hypothetical protein [Treponema sp.]